MIIILRDYSDAVDLHHHYSSPGTSLALQTSSRTKSKLHISLTSNTSTSSPHSLSSPTTPSIFFSSWPTYEPEISKILFNCPNKQSGSYPIPTWLLKVCASVPTPTITNIVNLSLTSRQFHPILKGPHTRTSPILPLYTDSALTGMSINTTMLQEATINKDACVEYVHLECELYL